MVNIIANKLPDWLGTEELFDMKFDEIKVICYQCKTEFGTLSFSLYKERYSGIAWNDKLQKLSKKLFCDEQCFVEYMKQFEVESYNGNPIYSIKVKDGTSRYMPYWGCTYWFASIEDCKARMDNKRIGLYQGGLI